VSIAFSMVSSLRMKAVSMTFGALSQALIERFQHRIMARALPAWIVLRNRRQPRFRYEATVEAGGERVL
jgi:hypothetical protein